MKRSSILIYLCLLLLCACSEQPSSQYEKKKNYSEDIEAEVNNRLDFINEYIFLSDSTLVLTQQQRNVLFPVLAEKIMLINEMKLEYLEDSIRKIKRKEIRDQWSPKIDALLNPKQVKSRHEYLSRRY